MHDQLTRADMGVAPGNSKTQPLTQEILERTNTANETADRVLSRLFQIKDRVFGVSPTTGQTGADQARPASSFADAFVGRSEDLQMKLRSIDSLTAELNDRL